MSCGKALPPNGAHVSTVSTTVSYIWFTDWLLAIGMDLARLALKIRNLSGNLQVQPVMQTALVRTDKPSAPSTLDAAQTANGEYCTGDEDISASTAGKLWVRFGVAISLTSGSSLGQADVALTTSFVQCGRLVGNWQGHVESRSTEDLVYTISGWIPAVLAEKIQVAGVISSRLGNCQLMVCYRTATTSTEAPSAWTLTDLEAAWHDADGEFNTGELTLSASTAMYVQVGLKVRNSSGTTLGQMDVAVTTCARRS